MAVFGQYSRYYDLLYRDKDYAGEADFIMRLVEKSCPGATSLMELGCGSGNHAARFAARGYDVEGVDLSEDMLAEARNRATTLPADTARKLRFSHGDVRSVRLDRKVDCVLSLFHVVSYQPENADVIAMFRTAREHLDKGGAFIFDCWYGPAVLTDPPAVRIKRMQDDGIQVTRLAEPKLYADRNIVDVHYNVFIRDLASQSVGEIQETHRMRYLFHPEIALFAETTGFQVEHSCEWMTERMPDRSTWGVCFILRAI